jgi:biotin operon repressor
MDNNATIGSEKRQQVFTLLQDGGANTKEIAEALEITRSTARDHINDLVHKDGIPLGTRREGRTKIFYYRPDAREYPINPSEPTGELRSKASVTKSAKEEVHELIRYLDKDLNGRAPAIPEDGLAVRDSHEDMVCHRSDDHIGAKYNDEYGNSTFDAEIGISRVRTVSDKVFSLKRRQEAAGVDFDTLHIIMGGDHVDGIGIYSDQPWEQELSLPEQLTVAGDLYMEFIDRASKEFESVQIVCQAGNHGELRGDGMGPDDNVDTAFFMILDRRVRDRGYDNVKFVRSESNNYVNFRMRKKPEEDRKKAEALGCEIHELPADHQSGHRAHLRHGQNSLEHIGTSAGKKRWYAWLNQHKFDIAYRGHYHTFQMDSIAGNRVIEYGAIIPPADFEESIAEWDEPAATVHGCSDERAVTWFYPVSFTDPPV